jgi:hypothetical protein
MICVFTIDSAQAESRKSSVIGEVEPAKEPDVNLPKSTFAANYLSLGISKNFPVDKGARQFQPGYYHPRIGYRYAFSDSWLMGISAQFKVLKTKNSGEVISLFTIEEQSLKIFRLYHPFYLLVGGKFMYLLPAKKPRLPIQKNGDLEIEVGAGATISLVYLINRASFFGAYIDQWRGTKTTKLQAIETGFFIATAVGN